MNEGSALYVGTVMHRRIRPKAHRLRYRVFWMLLDLDAIDGLGRQLRLFSRNRFNVVSFHDSDHGDGSGEPLRAQAERHLLAAGIAPDGGAIRLLCMPRIFGYGFNPLSIYFCHRRDDALVAILYQVHNTFGERHSYLIRVDAPASDRIQQRCDKTFYVSPFLDMEMSYAFRVTPPHERVAVSIRGSDKDGPLIVATLAGERRPLTDRTLLRIMATHPLLTFKVIGAIHFHALLLWWKGVGLRTRPRAPEAAVTIVHAKG